MVWFLQLLQLPPFLNSDCSDLPSPRDPSEAWAASQADRLMLYTRQLLTFCYNFYRAPYA